MKIEIVKNGNSKIAELSSDSIITSVPMPLT
jgi:hypothetical protein